MRSLSEFGAVEHHLQPPQGMRDAFAVVAARGGDDIWIEIRRKRAVVPTEVGPAASTTVAFAAETFAPAEAAAEHSEEAPPVPEEVELPKPREGAITAGTAGQSDAAPSAIETSAPDQPPAAHVESDALPAVEHPQVADAAQIQMMPDADPAGRVEIEEEPQLVETAAARQSLLTTDSAEEPEVYEIAVEATDDITSASAYDEVPMVATVAHREAPSAHLPPAAVQRIEPRRAIEAREASKPAVVLPMTRTLRIDVPPRTSPGHPAGMERLLGFASASGASALYLTSQSRPLLRIDGDIRAVEGEPTLTSAEVEAAMFELMPEAHAMRMRRGEPAEWVSEFAGDRPRALHARSSDYRGRVRCSS